jgi:uncharacterized repeat protein (TIGR01451 family)
MKPLDLVNLDRGRGRRLALLAVVPISVFAFVAVGSAAPPAGSTDLKISKTAGAGTINVGSPLTYTIQVENLGPDAATGVTVTDSLPKGVDYVSAASTLGSCALQGRKVVCAIGGLEAGATAKVSAATVTLNVVARKAGTISNTASVTGDQKDPVSSNNQATATTRILAKVPPPAGATCRGVPATIVGTSGPDTLLGTGGRDVITALGGSDTIVSSAGRDLVCAGSGSDFVGAGSAADRVIGGVGRDRLLGRGGNDVLKGNGGNDVLKGGPGSDRLRGDRGFDVCRGGAGLDSIRGCER